MNFNMKQFALLAVTVWGLYDNPASDNLVIELIKFLRLIPYFGFNILKQFKVTTGNLKWKFHILSPFLLKILSAISRSVNALRKAY